MTKYTVATESDALLRVRLFGPFQVFRYGTSAPIENWGRRKTKTLLKILISERGRVFTQDELIDKLFPNLDPENAVQNLHGRVSELRRILEPDLQKSSASSFVKTVGPNSYMFSRTAPCWVDVEEFELILDAGRKLQNSRAWQNALDQYAKAKTLYAEYLPEDRYEEWSLANREKLHGQFISLLFESSKSYIALKNYEDAIESLTLLTQHDPFHEEAYRLLMDSYVMTCAHGKALKTFAACEAALFELGASPATATQQAYLKIRHQNDGESTPALTRRRQKPISEEERYLRYEYAKGRYFLAQRTERGFQLAEKCFANSIARGPENPLAYSGLADALMLTSWFGYANQADRYPKAREAALSALQIDKNNAEAHTSLAYYFMNYKWNWKASEQSFQHAIEIKPTYATAHQWHAELLAATGHMDEAINKMQTALDLEPTSLLINTTMAWMHYLAQQYDVALEQCHQTLELDPNFGTAQWMCAQILIAQKRFAEAIPYLNRAHKLSGNHPGIIAGAGLAYARTGNLKLVKRCRRQIISLRKESTPDPLSMALIDVGLDEINQAADWLSEAMQQRRWLPPIIKTDPMFSPLNKHPLFQEAVELMGLGDNGHKRQMANTAIL